MFLQLGSNCLLVLLCVVEKWVWAARGREVTKWECFLSKYLLLALFLSFSLSLSLSLSTHLSMNMLGFVESQCDYDHPKCVDNDWVAWNVHTCDCKLFLNLSFPILQNVAHSQQHRRIKRQLACQAAGLLQNTIVGLVLPSWIPSRVALLPHASQQMPE